MPKPNRPNDTQSVVMRILRERLSIYKTNEGDQIVSNETIKELRNEIMDIIDDANRPETQKSGAYVYTPENSIQESIGRQGGKVDKNAARPKEV